YLFAPNQNRGPGLIVAWVRSVACNGLSLWAYGCHNSLPGYFMSPRLAVVLVDCSWALVDCSANLWWASF
ncbi:hypothetical protein Tsubulata_036645, partial [Turnera subulata]